MTTRRHSKSALAYDAAMTLMRRPGTRLVCMASGYFVVPGGPVEREVADKIKNHLLVRAGRDDSWPQHEQTWRVVS